MKLYFRILAVSTLSFISISFINAQSDYSIGLDVGYNRGLGFQASFTANKPLASLPIGVRIGLGYNKLEPGNSADARRIFINNATNGVPEKKAKSFDYRMDLLLPTSILGNSNSVITLGPRYSSFRANFKYVGGNEDFDVTSRQLGFGLGLESRYAISGDMDLFVGAGLDYFLDNTLIGHDTQYSPGDDNVNARNDNQNENVQFSYSDADGSISQPQLMPRLLVGVRLGI